MTRWIIGAGSRIDHGETAFAAAPSTKLQRMPVPRIGRRTVRRLQGAAAEHGVDRTACEAMPSMRTSR
ncbi:hypothetical protein [Luteimonas lutimaris]|uniref:hypothetical protein n=1 Tax=Luteimonas lutimaris TaxID=698645 RepID=UPI0031D4C004